MTPPNSLLSSGVLAINHVAGMIGLVILPIWIGVLVQYYRYDAQQAGLLVSLFLAAAVLTSIIFAALYERVSKRFMTAIGYLMAAIAFFLASHSESFVHMIIMHFIGGAGAGWGLSLTHGTIGRSENPHRLFSMAQLALGIFAIIFFAVIPNLILRFSGTILFLFLAGLMLLATIASLMGFPQYEKKRKMPSIGVIGPPIPSLVWFIIAGLIVLALNQALTSAYFERLGVFLGFPPQSISAVLVVAGIVILTPAIVAALFQNKIQVKTVAISGALAQGLLALFLFSTTNFWVYAVIGTIGGFVMIFTHIFLFGYLAALDPSGRAVAGTPAMIMFGSAFGPIIGGTLVVNAGYQWIGVTAAVIDAAAIIICFLRIKE